MKATGIVRRIDDLGRVVIPKEIRRTLRIREGDPLEIFTDREGEIILKKYSPIGELGTFAKEYADSLGQVAGMMVCICDRDAVIAAAGGAKKDLLEKNISPHLEQLMEQRVPYERTAGEEDLPVCPHDAYCAVAAVPILTDGDVTGCVLFVSEDETATADETAVRLCQAASQFLSKRLTL